MPTDEPPFVPAKIWEKGNCRDADTEIFYPDRDATTYSTVAGEAKAICRGTGPESCCPVLLECLFYGLITEDRFGIWGGMSVRERNALRRNRALIKYRSARHLQGTQYWRLIENYLSEHNEDEESVEQEAEGAPGDEEA